ncbi:MAG: Peptide methionine sulfoxide reductase MsrA [Candidatus Saccharibacteria bacterium]|nr:Peptide methionine sulfoxide reductase MsrA [Candidatus Saccharibacteria bacterium]
MEQALFAAGCFWGVQFYFDEVPGVTKTRVGYTGGHTENPTYAEVSSHTTGHAEAVLIEFDPEQINYEMLVRQFFRMHDPTQMNRQGPDIGDSYRTAIFYFDDEQRKIAERVKTDVQPNFDQPIVTEVTAAGPFYEAEEYHQKFTEKTGHGMCHIPYAPINA